MIRIKNTKLSHWQVQLPTLPAAPASTSLLFTPLTGGISSSYLCTWSFSTFGTSPQAQRDLFLLPTEVCKNDTNYFLKISIFSAMSKAGLCWRTTDKLSTTLPWHCKHDLNYHHFKSTHRSVANIRQADLP